MSVWKKIESKVLDKNVKMELLEKALGNMNISLDKTVHTLSNGYGSDTCSAALINSNGKVTSVGINFTNKGGLEIVGDLWNTGLGVDGGHQELLNKISQNYQVEHIKAKAIENLWNISATKVREDGKIEIELESYM